MQCSCIVIKVPDNTWIIHKYCCDIIESKKQNHGLLDFWRRMIKKLEATVT